MLLQLQQAKAKANKNLKSQTYDNMSYEDNEIQQDPDSNFTKVPSRPSGMIENQQKQKITHF